MADFDEWVGKSRRSSAYIDPWNVKALAAVLDIDAPSSDEPLPSLWHWLYFLETAKQSDIAVDGHPKKGDFLPPVENPRRMFAGARTHYKNALTIGCDAELVETITKVQSKDGAQGEMVIVSVQYDYHQNNQLCISEERDFIYLPEIQVDGVVPELQTELELLEQAAWSLDLETDAVLLFRFSALTFNSHRIHADLDYAQRVEGYPQLVVHGPLTAILVSECARANAGQTIKTFSFRAVAPMFCGQTVRVRVGLPNDEKKSAGQVYTPDARVAIKATVEFA